MKKLISLLFVTILAITLVACGGKNSLSKPDKTPLELLPADASLALKVSADFQYKAASDQYKDIQEIADAMMQEKHIEFEPATMEVEPGMLNGFTKEIDGFSEGVMFGPAIGSIPFVGYIFVSDDPEELADTLMSFHDLRWNVCTQADEFQCSIVKDKVCFVMCPKSLDD